MFALIWPRQSTLLRGRRARSPGLWLLISLVFVFQGTGALSVQLSGNDDAESRILDETADELMLVRHPRLLTPRAQRQRVLAVAPSGNRSRLQASYLPANGAHELRNGVGACLRL